ncbi:MAG: aldose epimerase [Mycobacterium sp.]
MCSAIGTEYELTRRVDGRWVRGVITGVGAAVRQLSVDGVELTPGFDDPGPPPFYSGKVLIPWPNRVREGRWTHDGDALQLDITDPRYGTALHGLLCNIAHSPIERSDSSITLGAPVPPQPGYPFHLETEVRYQLTADGLATTHAVRNAGSCCAPVAIGAHPFLAIGDVPAETLLLTVDGEQHIDVDKQLIPVGVTAVAGTEWDLRDGRRIADLDLDDCWSVRPGPKGDSIHTLRAPDGRTVSLWADEHFGFVHVFITREYPRNGGLVTAVALEPMTAQANALGAGVGMRWLQPGETLFASWAIRYADGDGGHRRTACDTRSSRRGWGEQPDGLRQGN